MNSFKQFFTESSLSRIWRWIDKYSTGFITAFRKKEYTVKQNKERNKELYAALRAKGYLVTKVDGSYIENFKSDHEVEVDENTFFVVNPHVEGDDGGALERDLRKLGEHYDQDSILIVRDHKVGMLIGTSHREDSYPGFNVEKRAGEGKWGHASGQFYSKINGRKFAFEEGVASTDGISLVENGLDPDTYFGKMAMHRIGNDLWKVVDGK